MKRARENDLWFEHVEHVLPGHGFVRFYRVTCRKCSAHADIRNTGQANEVLQKIFTRKNWDIGRAKNLHHCPACAKTPQGPGMGHNYGGPPTAKRMIVPPPLVPPRPARVPLSLSELWEQASEDERRGLWNYFRVMYGIDHIAPHYEMEVADWQAWHQQYAPHADAGQQLVAALQLFDLVEKTAEPAPTPAPTPAPAPAPEPVEQSVDDDDENTADWWREVHGPKK
jgi:hypothetical protein